MGLVKHWIVRDNAGNNPRVIFDEERVAPYRNGGGWKIEGPFGSDSRLAAAEAQARGWWDAYEDFERTGSMAALNRMGEAARNGAQR